MWCSKDRVPRLAARIPCGIPCGRPPLQRPAHLPRLHQAESRSHVDAGRAAAPCRLPKVADSAAVDRSGGAAARTARREHRAADAARADRSVSRRCSTLQPHSHRPAILLAQHATLHAQQQPCVSRGRCSAVKLQIEHGCAAARAAQNERLAQVLRPEGTGLYI